MNITTWARKNSQKENYDAAHAHLTELYDNWRLDADKYKNIVQWLFASSLAKNDHGDTVKYFEVLKEKFPDVEISFENILRVAKSYRELGEYERSYLVYRATVEGSFERESQVAGFLNARGEFVRSVQAMERLLRDYPAESYVATATYALAQETYRRAAERQRGRKAEGGWLDTRALDRCRDQDARPLRHDLAARPGGRPGQLCIGDRFDRSGAVRNGDCSKRKVRQALS